MNNKLYFIFILITTIISFSSCSKTEKSSNTIIYLMGDSLTASNYGDYTKHFKKFLLKRKLYSYKAFTLARPGNNTKEYLAFLKDKIKNIKPVKYKVNKAIFVLLLGTNDVRIDGDNLSLSQFKSNYKEIIKIIRKNFRKINTKIYLVTPPPIFNADLYTFTKQSSRRIEEEIVPAVKKLCLSEHTKLIDLNSFLKKNPKLIPGIHPTPQGYFAMSKFIFNSIFETKVILGKKIIL